MALSTFNVSDVFLKLAEQEGINLSVEGVDDVCYGCVIAADKTFNSFLADHALPYNFQIIDGDPIRVVRRPINDSLTIDHSLTQADCVVSGGAAAVSIKRIDVSDLPRELEIQYTDPDRQFATTTRTARHLGAPTTNPGRSIEIDFLISATQAREMAFDTLYRIWSQQLTMNFEHRDITIEPGDTIHITCDQGVYVVLVQEATYTVSRTTQIMATVLLASSGVTLPPGGFDNWPPAPLSPDAITSPDVRVTNATFAGAGHMVVNASIVAAGAQQLSAAFSGASNAAFNAILFERIFAVLTGSGNLAANATITGATQIAATFAGVGAMIANTTTVPSAEASAFLARTSGLDSTHRNAYIGLIDGLVNDGVWSKFDALWVLATQDETTALLNLCSTSYGLSKTNSPTFTADQGFAGDGTNYLNNGTAYSSLTQFTQNSAHVMLWDLTSGGSSGRAIGESSTSTNKVHIHPRYSDTNAYFRVNRTNAGANGNVANTKGCSLATRTDSTTVTGYKNGSWAAANVTDTSEVRSGQTLCIPEPGSPSTDLIAAASVGGGLSATDASNLYSRLYTYLQAVGISSPT